LDRLLRELADTVVVQTWTHVTHAGDTLPMRNLIARFRPAATERVLYAAHWDTQPFATGPNSPDPSAPTPGANNNAGGVAVLLGVADALHQEPTQTIGVDLLLTDGEDLGDFDRMRDVLVGSTYYGQHPVTDDVPLFAIVFDMIADADLQIYQEGNSTRAAPEVVDRVWRTARDLGYQQYFIPDIEHYIIDDHRALSEAGIRAILLIDFDYEYWDSTEDTIDKISEASLTIVGNTAIRVLRNADR
jgi:Zn-dependent M28 family amino/carboxypeptidase